MACHALSPQLNASASVAWLAFHGLRWSVSSSELAGAGLPQPPVTPFTEALWSRSLLLGRDLGRKQQKTSSIDQGACLGGIPRTFHQGGSLEGVSGALVLNTW